MTCLFLNAACRLKSADCVKKRTRRTEPSINWIIVMTYLASIWQDTDFFLCYMMNVRLVVVIDHFLCVLLFHTPKVVCSFVCSFFTGRGPACCGPQRWDLYIGPMRQPRKRRGIGRCVRCMCALCRVQERIVGMSSLSGISKRAPSMCGLLSG